MKKQKANVEVSVEPTVPPLPGKGDLVFIKNCSREGAGAFEAIVLTTNIPSRVIDLEAGQPLPDPGECRAVIILGGPMSANDDSDQMQALLTFTQVLLDRTIPLLGICLGMQVIVKAAGGTVQKHALRETGIIAPDRRPYTMALTESGLSNPIFENAAHYFPPIKLGATVVIPIFQLHGETVLLPENGPLQLLATGFFCTIQAIAAGPRAWGIQGHVEMNRELLERLMQEDSSLNGIDRIGLLRDLELQQHDYGRGAELVLRNFIRLSGF